MKLFQLLFLVGTLLQTFVFAAKDLEYAQRFMDENGVIQVNNKNYANLRRGVKGYWSVCFFSSRQIDASMGACEICEHFDVVFSNVARSIKEADPDAKVLFYFIDVKNTLSALKDFDISYIPHLYVFEPPVTKTIWVDQPKLVYKLNFEDSKNEWIFASFLNDYVELPMSEMEHALSRDKIIVETPEDMSNKSTTPVKSSMKESHIKKRSQQSGEPKKKKSRKSRKPVTSVVTATNSETESTSSKKRVGRDRKKQKSSEKSSEKSVINKFTVPSVDEPVESFKNSRNTDIINSFVTSVAENTPEVGTPVNPGLRKNQKEETLDVGSFSTVKTKNEPSIDHAKSVGKPAQQGQQQQEQELEQQQQQNDQVVREVHQVENGNGMSFSYDKNLIKPMTLVDYAKTFGDYFKTIFIAIAVYYFYDQFLFKMF